MASAGYGIELTVEGIWDKLWDTDQFGFINILLGTQFNFWITNDGATDITNTKIKPMLEAETNILFAYWRAIVKIETVTAPWEFINVWIRDNLQGDKFFYFYQRLIKTCQDILYGSMEMVTRNLPSANTRTY